MARAPWHLVNPDSLNNLNTPKTAMCGVVAPRHLVFDSMSATCKTCVLAHALVKIQMKLSPLLPDHPWYARIIDEALRRVREAA